MFRKYVLGSPCDSHTCLCLSIWPLHSWVSHFPQSGDDDNQSDDDDNQSNDDDIQLGDDDNQSGDDANQSGDDYN